MAWKIEKWMKDVLPGAMEFYNTYASLSDREAAIIASNILDVALADLLSQRLMDYPKDCEEFLGLNADGRAPCGSFGARIQLALLLGMLTPSDAAILRAIKNIRNEFAHRVTCTFFSPNVVKILDALHPKLISLLHKREPKTLADVPMIVSTPEFCKGARESSDAGRSIVFVCLVIYQTRLHVLSEVLTAVSLVPDLADEAEYDEQPASETDGATGPCDGIEA